MEELWIAKTRQSKWKTKVMLESNFDARGIFFFFFFLLLHNGILQR